MSRSVVFAVFCAAFACSAEEGRAPPLPPFSPHHVGPSRAQGDALGRLQNETGSPWRVGFDPRFQSPDFAAGHTPPLLGGGRSPTEAARDFLRQYRDLFLIGDPDTELAAVAEVTDQSGRHHVDFTQQLAALRVHAARLRVHFDAQGSIRVVSGRFIPHLDPALADAVAIGLGTAAQLATDDLLAALPSALPTDVAALTAPELVLFPDGAKPRPAYHVRLRVAHQRVLAADYMIDAETGDVVGRFNDTRALSGSGIGVHGDRKPLEVSEVLRSDGSLEYRLLDQSRAISTRTAGGTAVSSDLEPALVASVSPTDGWDPAGVDAHYNLGVTYDYFSGLGRASFDGAGAPILATVHIGSELGDFAGSAWDHDSRQLLFTDASGGKFPGAGALDVVAHEFSHGVVDYTAALEYTEESGALQEAIADIFGCLVEHDHQPNDANNVTIGEDVTGGAPIRDLGHPQKTGQPDHVSALGTPARPGVARLDDTGDVHRNAGVPANAWYLMTVGGRNETSGAVVARPIGWDASQKVWYRALTEYLHERSGFEAAALATVQAAQDLFGDGSPESRAVSCAWAATGVLPNGCNAAPPSDCRAPAEPNDNADQASGVVQCHPMCGTLSKSSPVDWYVVQVSAGQSIEIRLTGLAADYDLYLLDDAGQVLFSSATPGTADEAITGEFNRDGKYYVQVTGTTSFSSVPYRLTLGSEPACRLIKAIAGINIDPRNEQAYPRPDEVYMLGATRLRVEFKVELPCDRVCTLDDSGRVSDLEAAFPVYDSAISKYTDQGIDVLLVLDYQTACVPGGAARDLSNSDFEMRYLPAFRDRVARIAQHYKGNQHVRAYEIWNEEDLDSDCNRIIGQACGRPATYCPYLPPERYAELLVEAAQAVHREGSSSQRVVMGGLGAGQWPYVGRVAELAGSGWSDVDAVGVHPYAKWPSPNPSNGQDSMIAFLSAAEGGKPLYVTEWGTDNDAVQPQMIYDYFVWFSQNPGFANVQESYFFAWSDAQRPGFGLFKADGNPKPSWQTFHDLATKGP